MKAITKIQNALEELLETMTDNEESEVYFENLRIKLLKTNKEGEDDYVVLTNKYKPMSELLGVDGTIQELNKAICNEIYDLGAEGFKEFYLNPIEKYIQEVENYKDKGYKTDYEGKVYRIIEFTEKTYQVFGNLHIIDGEDYIIEEGIYVTCEVLINESEQEIIDIKIAEHNIKNIS